MTGPSDLVETQPLDHVDVEARHVRERVRGALFGEGKPIAIGRFEIVSVVGRGGMGVVYAARDPRLDRLIALKLVHLEPRGPGSSSSSTARLLQEARALAKLSHPNVVPVHEVMEHDGHLAFAMELVDGGDLQAWRSTRPGWREQIRVLIEAGRGLAAAHAAGLVHRDFKPQNVLVGTDGRARVTDFGLARGIEGEQAPATEDDSGDVVPADRRLTRSGALLGTPPYMSPERWKGEPADARSDQFAFGVTAYEVLFAQRPFVGASIPALTEAILSGRPRPFPPRTAVPRRIRRAILRAMAVDPADRFAGMTPLLDELQRAASPRRRSALLVALGAIGAGSAVWLATASSPCGDSAAALADVWSPARAEAMRRTYEESGDARAIEAWAHIGPVLDAHGAQWIAEHSDACEAALVEERETERDMDLRMTCLAGQRRALDALLGQLEALDADATDNSVAAVAQLDDPSRCGDAEALRASPIEPPPPQDAERVGVLQDRLAPLQAMTGLGRGADAADAITGLLADAESVGYTPLLAEAYATLGEIRSAEDAFDEQITANRRAFELALDAKDDRLAVVSALSLATLFMEERRDDAEAKPWIEQAEAIVRRHRLDGETRCRTELRRCAFHRKRKEIDALRLASQRVEERCTLEEVGPVVHIMSLTARGGAAMGTGDPAAAEELTHAAAVLAKDTFGPHHPDYAAALHGWGAALFNRGSFEDAQEVLREARGLYVEIYGPSHSRVAALDAARAGVELVTGHHEEALKLLEGAREILRTHDDQSTLEEVLIKLLELHYRTGHVDETRKLGAELIETITAARGGRDPALITVLITLTNLEARDSRWDAAAALVERAERAIVEAVGADHYYMGVALQLRAQIEAGRGDLVRGLEAIDRAIALSIAAQRPPGEMGSMRMVRASLLSDLGRTREARAEAELARAQFAAAGPVFAAMESNAAELVAELSG